MKKHHPPTSQESTEETNASAPVAPPDMARVGIALLRAALGLPAKPAPVKDKELNTSKRNLRIKKGFSS